MAQTLQEILNGVQLTGANSGQLAQVLNPQQVTQRTEEELREAAARAVGSLYNQKELSAKQQYEQTSGSLKSQLDSLGATYSRQREDAQKNTRLAASTADQRALSRGMGRSSYNEATVGNIQNEGNKLVDYINTAQTNASNDVNSRIALASQQLGEILYAYQVDRETDILGRMDELRSTDLNDVRAATEYNNSLIMALADRLSQQREQERMAGLQEREMSLKEKAEAFDQMMDLSTVSGSSTSSGKTPPKTPPASKSFVGKSEPVRQTYTREQLDAIAKQSGLASSLSKFAPGATTPAAPIRYQDGYSTAGVKIPTLLSRFKALGE